MGMGFAMFGAAAAEKFQRIVEFWAIRPPSLLALGVFRALFCRCCDEYGHPASSHYRGYGWSQSKIAYMRAGEAAAAAAAAGGEVGGLRGERGGV